MTDEKKSRWLVENIFKTCWHEWDFSKGDLAFHVICKKCKSIMWNKELNKKRCNPDFYTTDPDWQAINFFKLWNKVKEEEWFSSFLVDNWNKKYNWGENAIQELTHNLISCSTLADAIGDYFKWEKSEAS